MPGIPDLSVCINFTFVMAGYDKIIGISSVMLTVLTSKVRGNPQCISFSNSTSSSAALLKFERVDLVLYILLIFFLFSLNLIGLQSVGKRISKKNGVISVLACLFVFYCFFFGSPLLSNDWLDYYTQLGTVIGEFSSKNLSLFKKYNALTRSDWFLQSGFRFDRMYFLNYINLNGRAPEIWLNKCLDFCAYLLSENMQAPDITTNGYIKMSPACVDLFTIYLFIIRVFCATTFLSGFAEHLKLMMKSAKVAVNKYNKSVNIIKSDTAASTPSTVPSAKKTKARSRSKSSGRR